MIPLFGKTGSAVLEAFTFTRTLYAFDFDGTLARIVRVPENARMAPKTEALLRRLSELAPVAIVSGRSVADLRRRIPFEPAYLVGNHGLEGLGTRKDSLEKAAEICAAWKRELAPRPWAAGVEVEDKAFSLALHYRRARARAQARRQLEQALESLQPAPRVIRGKFVFNLLPPGAPHKGAAILDLLRVSGMRHVFYVGDDDTDEDVFGLAEELGQAITVRVGKKKDSHAGYFIERQAQIDRLLRMLIAWHELEPGSGSHRRLMHA